MLDAFAMVFADEFLDLRGIVGRLVDRDADLPARCGHGAGEQAGELAFDVEVANLAEVGDALVEKMCIRDSTMTALTQAHCEACRADAPHVSDEELHVLLRQIPDWNIEVRDGIMQLEKVYLFKNFKHALAFTNAVGEISEAEGHHPGLLTEWGKVLSLIHI